MLISSIFQYLVQGCSDIKPEGDMWFRRSGGSEHASVGCSSTTDSWNLKCVNRNWVGQIGNCTSGGLNKNESMVHTVEYIGLKGKNCCSLSYTDYLRFFDVQSRNFFHSKLKTSPWGEQNIPMVSSKNYRRRELKTLTRSLSCLWCGDSDYHGCGRSMKDRIPIGTRTRCQANVGDSMTINRILI